MPFKERTRQSKLRKRAKPKYSVKNWCVYNRGLRKRGMISLYFPTGDMRSQFINEQTYVQGVSGQLVKYSPAYIELIYTLYLLFGWGMRQITGYMEDYWSLTSTKLDVPSYSHLSERFATLDVSVKQRCDCLAGKLKRGERISVIADSTGLRLDRQGEWVEHKHKQTSGRKSWNKFHILTDLKDNVLACQVTDERTADSNILDEFLSLGIPMDQLLADGAYYCIERNRALHKSGVTAVIPPPRDAVVHGKAGTKLHDQTVQYIKDKKTIYAFHQKSGYGLRSRIEAQFSRIKRCITDKLRTQRNASRKNEGVIISNIINLWNTFGKPMSFKKA